MADPEEGDGVQGNTDGAGTGDAGGAPDEGGTGSAGDAGAGDGAVTPTEFSDFTVPEGKSLDDAVLATFKEQAGGMGLTQENAQQFIDMGIGLVDKTGEALLAAQQEAQQAKSTEWIEELKSDSEFGGDNFEATVDNAARVMKEYGDESLRDMLNESGYGNHPALIKMMAKVGKLLGEDSSTGGRPAHKDSSEKSDGELFYPDSK